jgi:hypothetical protein
MLKPTPSFPSPFFTGHQPAKLGLRDGLWLSNGYYLVTEGKHFPKQADFRRRSGTCGKATLQG